jgi:DNA-binding transcriptional LysR family regulator
MGTPEEVQHPAVGSADLDAVRVFVQVVQAGGFTAAARRLQMPKSTVSRRVSELETQLGARLLQRTTRSLALTDVGSAYFARVERALGELSDAERAVAQLHELPRGVLRMTAPSDFAQLFLSDIAAAYQRAYPEVSLVVDLDNRRADLVAEGYDLALRASARLDDSSLVARRLLTGTHALFASPGYLAQHGEPQTPSELQGHNLVLFRSEKLRERLKLQRGNETTSVDVQGRLSSNDLGFVKRATLDGLGMGALPVFTACQELRGGLLRRVLPDHDLGTSAVFAVYPSARHLTPKVRTFIELAASYLEQRSRDAEHACTLSPAETPGEAEAAALR